MIISQLIKNIKRDLFFGKLSILNKSRISELGEISFSVVRLHLVHFSVKVPTSLWSKSSCGLICTEVFCIGFSNIIVLMGQ